jgi:hypothetical protein
MGIRPESLWKLRQRYPGLDNWVCEEMRRMSSHLIGPVLLKTAQMAIRGSVQHARLFLEAVGELKELNSAGGANAANQLETLVVRIAVPRPGDPPVSASPALLPEVAVPGGLNV